MAQVVGSILDFISIFAEFKRLCNYTCTTYEDVETIVPELLDARFDRLERCKVALDEGNSRVRSYLFGLFNDRLSALRISSTKGNTSWAVFHEDLYGTIPRPAVAKGNQLTGTRIGEI